MVRKLLRHPLVKSSLIYTLTDAANRAIPFFLLPVLTYYLVPADYGIISNFNIVLSILFLLVGINMDGAISVNFYKFEKTQLAAYISNTLLVILVSFATCLCLVVLFTTQIYKWVEVPFIYQIAAVVIAFCQMITAINLSLWRLEEKALNFGLYEISQTVLNLSLSLYFIITLSLGWKGRVDGILLASISYGLFSLLFLQKRGYLKFNFNKAYIMDALKFGFPLVPHGLSFWIRSGVDRILITSMIGVAATGIYATGFQFGILISVLVMAFNNAFAPYLFKQLSQEGDLALVKKKLVKITYYILFGLIVLCVIFTLISVFLVNTLLADTYAGATEFVFWAILAQTFQGMYLLFVNYIFFAKKTKKLAMITFSCSLIHVFLCYVLIKSSGAIGAAYSSVIVSFINFVAVWMYSRKVYPMPWFK